MTCNASTSRSRHASRRSCAALNESVCQQVLDRPVVNAIATFWLCSRHEHNTLAWGDSHSAATSTSAGRKRQNKTREGEEDAATIRPQNTTARKVCGPRDQPSCCSQTRLHHEAGRFAALDLGRRLAHTQRDGGHPRRTCRAFPVTLPRRNCGLQRGARTTSRRLILADVLPTSAIIYPAAFIVTIST